MTFKQFLSNTEEEAYAHCLDNCPFPSYLKCSFDKYFSKEIKKICYQELVGKPKSDCCKYIRKVFSLENMLNTFEKDL